MSILSQIVDLKRQEVQRRKARVPVSALKPAAKAPRSFAEALQSPGVAAICEVKRRSPSRGALREDLCVGEVAQAYASSGATAISVLTDEPFFGGTDADLQAASAAVDLPLLRKDFTIDPYQVYESRAIGAAAVLLIVRVLTDDELRTLLALARDLTLSALVEVHDEAELRRALACDAQIIGVNSRDLDSFEVSLDHALRMRAMIPAGRITVAESGIHTADDVRRVRDAGFDAILVGEALMTADDPGAKLRELLRGVHV